MNILFLVDPLQNYVSDPLHLGLVRVLGQQRVIHYPPKAIYHDPSAKLWFLPQLPKIEKTEEEIRDFLEDRFFDVVCISSHRQEPLQVFARLYQHSKFPPIVFIDESDDTDIRHEIPARYPIVVYFKREYPWRIHAGVCDSLRILWSFRGNRRLFERTVPLPMSVVLDALPDLRGVAKTADVSYTGRASHPRRISAFRILSDMQDIRFSGAIYASPGDRKYKLQAGWFERIMTKIFDNTPVDDAALVKKKMSEEYYQEIGCSKIAISIRGGGWLTPRYFEIPAMGTLLLSERPEITIPDNFEDRQHAVFCKNDLSDLEELVRYYLREHDERERIAQAGRDHLLKYHTCERRAQYFLDVCARMI